MAEEAGQEPQWVALQSLDTDPASMAGMWGPFDSEQEGYEWVREVDRPDDNLVWSVVPLNNPIGWGKEVVL